MAEVHITRLRDALRAHAPRPQHTVTQIREKIDTDARAFAVPADVRVESCEIAGVPAELITPPSPVDGRSILYLHGGGYACGSPRTVRALASRIGAEAGARVINLGYRLAPEHPCPAAIEDVVTTYDELVERGQDPRRIAIGGDSAGGGLTVSALVAIRDLGRRLPAAGFCISPWTDLTLVGASIDANAEKDPMVPRWFLDRLAGWYGRDRDRGDPQMSPANADLTGLPPLLVQAGGCESLLDDALLLTDVAETVGVEAILEVWPEMIHVWHQFAPRLPESNAAIARIGAWLRQHLG